MTVVALIPALVAIVGAIVYLVPGPRPSLKQIALVAFGVGLLVWLLRSASEVVRL